MALELDMSVKLESQIPMTSQAAQSIRLPRPLKIIHSQLLTLLSHSFSKNIPLISINKNDGYLTVSAPYQSLFYKAKQMAMPHFSGHCKQPPHAPFNNRITPSLLHKHTQLTEPTDQRKRRRRRAPKAKRSVKEKKIRIT